MRIDTGLALTSTALFACPNMAAPAPSLTITSGSGYAGSVYTSTVAGQWFADDSAIPDANGTTFEMPLALEGKALRCGASNTIRMWRPQMLGAIAAVMDIRQGLSLSGTAVSAWASQVGTLIAGQASTSARPQASASAFAGTPALTFDGGDELLDLALATTPSARTVVCGVVFNGTGSRSIFGAAQSGGYVLRVSSGNLLQVGASNVTILATATATVTGGSPLILVSRFVSSGPYDFRANGGSLGSGTASGGFWGSGTARIGSTAAGDVARMNGAIASIIAFDAWLSEAEVQRAEGWIAHTSGTSSLLPTGHPYKTEAPRA